MDSLESFVNSSLEINLPFVVYRKPKEEKVNAYRQRDAHLHYVERFDKEGFIFAPFDTDKAPVFFSTTHSDRYEFLFNEILEDLPVKKVKSKEEERHAHIRLVQDGIDAIKQGEMKKVVLSRKHTETIDKKSPLNTLKRLLHKYHKAFVYCWYHPKVGLWMGATPETLVSIKNRRLETMALAGTQAYRGDDTPIWGEKEQEEQALVTQAIVENLSPLLDHKLNINGPFTSRAGSLIHLKTKITAPIDLTKTNLESVIKALHPTPAICGLPRLKATQFIKTNENYDREYYTGYLGELNLKETQHRAASSRNTENRAYASVKTKSAIYVNLRCMQWVNNQAYIYVGGGITKGSIPNAEWEETENKMATMHNILETD